MSGTGGGGQYSSRPWRPPLSFVLCQAPPPIPNTSCSFCVRSSRRCLSRFNPSFPHFSTPAPRHSSPPSASPSCNPPTSPLATRTLTCPDEFPRLSSTRLAVSGMPGSAGEPGWMRRSEWRRPLRPLAVEVGEPCSPPPPVRAGLCGESPGAGFWGELDDRVMAWRRLEVGW